MQIRLYPVADDFEKANDDLCHALDAYEEIYMELGMKAGARIIFQLLLTDDPNQF